jgi:hypothetical protein
MMGNSLVGKTWEMQNQAADAEAETQLQALEARLAGAAPTVSSTSSAPQQVQVGVNGPPSAGAATPVDGPAQPMSDAERQLEELEKRMKGE